MESSSESPSESEALKLGFFCGLLFAVLEAASAAILCSQAEQVAISFARMEAKIVSPGTLWWHLRQLAVAKLPWHWIRRSEVMPARPSRLSMFCV